MKRRGRRRPISPLLSSLSRPLPLFLLFPRFPVSLFLGPYRFRAAAIATVR
jgi:hypothetical protein